jgi:dienelactone hydrolase
VPNAPNGWLEGARLTQPHEGEEKMGPYRKFRLTTHSHTNPRRILLVMLLLAALVADVGHAQAPSVRTSPADSPFPDISGAQWVKIEGASGQKFLTAIFRPEGTGPFPVVVMLHGGQGLSKPFMSLTQDVSRGGFLVVAGCWRAGTPLCSEATPQAEWAANPAHSGKELIAMARTLPDARADRIGLYGFSIGGYAALFAASSGADVQAVVADAPAHVPTGDPRPPKTLDVLPGLTAPLLLMHGTADKLVPVAQSREYEQAARAGGKVLVVSYFEGVGHIASVQPESQAEARQRAIAFLREHLSK